MGATAVVRARRVTLDRDRLLTGGVIGVAMLIGIALRVPFLHSAFGPDEGGVSFIAQRWGTGHGSLYGAYWLDRPPYLVALYKLAVTGGMVGVRTLGAVASMALVALTAAIAYQLGGHRAARIAALLSTGMASSFALHAVFTPAELLASVPAAASILCLVVAHRTGSRRMIAGAGALAATALLVKQSFIDAGAAGLVFLALEGGLGGLLAYAAGVAASVAVALIGLTAMGGTVGGLVYALFGFRIDALSTLSSSTVPLHVRMLELEGPALWSGLVLLLALLPLAVRRLGDRHLLAMFGAWLVAGVVGVLAGGSYWPHYLIQLVAPTSVLAALALRTAPRPLRVVAVLAVLGVSVGATASGAVHMQRHPTGTRERAIARFIRAHARPGDTQYVMYAKAQQDYYDGLPSPYPYAWSLMVRGIPSAIPRLDRLLASPRRPTWIVAWQPASIWGLDPQGHTQHLLREHYRRVGGPHLHPIWLRKDRALTRSSS